MGEKMTKRVLREIRISSRILKIFIGILGVLTLLMGIIFDRGFLFPCFCLAGLYLFFEAKMEQAYEYVLTHEKLEILVFKGKYIAKTKHVVYLEDLIVVAPHAHPAVEKYRKGGSEKIRKYDYTSYTEGIEYYTMIANWNHNQTKFLLDLDDEMLRYLKRRFPQKVFLDSYPGADMAAMGQ